MSEAQRRYIGKVVIVTGGAMGMGQATAIAFGREGASVIVADIDDAAGAETVQAIEAAGGHGRYVKGDVGKSEAARHAIDAAVETYGGLDVIFNNVGIQPAESYCTAEDTPEEVWDRIMDVNVKSHFLMAKYGIPHIRKRGGGAIINNALSLIHI